MDKEDVIRDYKAKYANDKDMLRGTAALANKLSGMEVQAALAKVAAKEGC